MEKYYPKSSKVFRGFTLIETIIYVALLSLLMTGVVGAGFGLIDASGKTAAKIMVDEEGNFLLKKINWALTGATSTSVTIPALNGTSTSLTVKKSALPAGESPLTFEFNAGVLSLTRNSGTSMPLSSENVTVTNLVFFRVAAIGGKPEMIRVTFMLNGRNFDMTKYLRQ